MRGQQHREVETMGRRLETSTDGGSRDEGTTSAKGSADTLINRFCLVISLILPGFSKLIYFGEKKEKGVHSREREERERECAF